MLFMPCAYVIRTDAAHMSLRAEKVIYRYPVFKLGGLYLAIHLEKLGDTMPGQAARYPL